MRGKGKERRAEGKNGKQGGRMPRADRTINHRGNSIDGSLLLEGASGACQTYLASVERPAKRRIRFDGVPCRRRDTACFSYFRKAFGLINSTSVSGEPKFFLK